MAVNEITQVPCTYDFIFQVAQLNHFNTLHSRQDRFAYRRINTEETEALSSISGSGGTKSGEGTGPVSGGQSNTLSLFNILSFLKMNNDFYLLSLFPPGYGEKGFHLKNRD